VFFGDMGGNFYALDAATGQKLWGKKIGGAINSVGGTVFPPTGTSSHERDSRTLGPRSGECVAPIWQRV